MDMTIVYRYIYIPQVVGLIARLARTCIPDTRTGDYHSGILFSPASHTRTTPRQYDHWNSCCLSFSWGNDVTNTGQRCNNQQ